MAHQHRPSTLVLGGGVRESRCRVTHRRHSFTFNRAVAWLAESVRAGCVRAGCVREHGMDSMTRSIMLIHCMRIGLALVPAAKVCAIARIVVGGVLIEMASAEVSRDDNGARVGGASGTHSACESDRVRRLEVT